MGRIHSTTNSFRLLLLFLSIVAWSNYEVSAQVKIGDNPQTIDAGSILELESNELVLVITRVTTQQMKTLRPMAGALVFNTDVGCVHSFNGTTWVNLCGQGGTGGVSAAPGNAITDNGGAFYNDETLQNQVSENSIALNEHIANDEDLDGTNELSNLALNGNVITLSNPLDPTNEIDLTPILGGTGSGSNNSTFEVASGNLSITDGGGTLSVPLTELGGENATNELISDGAVVGNDLIINEGVSNQVTIDVTSLVGGGSGSNNSTFEVASGNLSITDGGGTLSVPLTDLNTGTDTHLGNTNLTQTGGNRSYNLNGQNLSFSGAGNLGIGATAPQEKLHVGGNLRLDGQFLDSTGDAGGSGEVLSATGTGTNWISASAASSPYHALGKMNEASITKSTNVFLVSDLGIGQYQVFFGAPAGSPDYVIQLSLFNIGAGSIEVISQSANAFTVQIYNNSGSPADGSWFFTVIDF